MFNRNRLGGQQSPWFQVENHKWGERMWMHMFDYLMPLQSFPEKKQQEQGEKEMN